MQHNVLRRLKTYARRTALGLGAAGGGSGHSSHWWGDSMR